MSWECVSYWIEHHPGLASWVQAIGSIAAILAAVWIANRDSVLRRRMDNESRRGALARAVTVTQDASLRVSMGINSLEEFGAQPKLIKRLLADMANCQKHLREVLLSQGVDPATYAELFVVTVAVEDTAHNFRILEVGASLNEEEQTSTRQALNKINTALSILTTMQSK